MPDKTNDHATAAGKLCTDDGSGCCATCGVSLTTCESCAGVGYHAAGCPDVEVTAETVRDEQIRKLRTAAWMDNSILAAECDWALNTNQLWKDRRAYAREICAAAINARNAAVRK